MDAEDVAKIRFALVRLEDARFQLPGVYEAAEALRALGRIVDELSAAEARARHQAVEIDDYARDLAAAEARVTQLEDELRVFTERPNTHGLSPSEWRRLTDLLAAGVVADGGGGRDGE